MDIDLGGGVKKHVDLPNHKLISAQPTVITKRIICRWLVQYYINLMFPEEYTIELEFEGENLPDQQTIQLAVVRERHPNYRDRPEMIKVLPVTTLLHRYEQS